MNPGLKIIKNNDASLDLLKNIMIGIIGFGNQGKAQALNLKDRGFNIKVGLRSNSKSLKHANEHSIDVDTIENVVLQSDLICLMLPDKILPNVYNERIKNNLREGQTLLFAHGFNVHYNIISIPLNIDIVMVAPSGGGAVVRNSFLEKSGVPSLIAVHQDYTGKAFDITKSYSRAIGCTRICSFLSTFQEETETDLFGEQAILTGALPKMIETSLKVLLDAGYSLEVAWFVCYYEVKTIVDLFHDKGFEYLFNAISDTARYGGLSRGDYLIDSNYEKKLKNILSKIKDGSFKKELSESGEDVNYKSKLSLSDNNDIKKLMDIVFKKKVEV